MGLLIVSIISWLCGLLTLLLPFFILSGGSGMMKASMTTSLITSVIVFQMLNVPCLLWLRQRMTTERQAGLVPLRFVLSLNTLVLLLTTFLAGRTLSPADAFLFIGTSIVLWAAFGMGTIWSYREKVV